MKQHQANYETFVLQNYLIILLHEHYAINNLFFNLFFLAFRITKTITINLALGCRTNDYHFHFTYPSCDLPLR